MSCALNLPLPTLTAQPGASVPFLTDEALAARFGVRIAFTGRDGGASQGAYGSLNLGSHVGDNPADVDENRARLLLALDAEGSPLIVPNQVHGTEVVQVRGADATSLRTAREQAAVGADALAVHVPGVAALLCYADCCPVILVASSGRFCVVHAGWRGAVAGIAGAAARVLAQADAAARGVTAAQAAAGMNAYIGLHIRQECFEVGEEVAERFAARFGPVSVPSFRHVSLAAAVSSDLQAAGLLPERIADAGICTVCECEQYFSYRASGGVCGRHGAAAIRWER